jgi:hypothetical protein
MNARPQLPDRPLPLRVDRSALIDGAMRSFVRTTLAKSLAVLDRGDDAKYAEKTWPNDRDVPLLLRASTAPTTIASAQALASVAFLQNLVPLSAGAAVLARGLGLTFDGASQISIPSLTLPAANFVGEAQPIPVQQGNTAAVSMAPAKFATIIVLTGEMMRHSNAEAIVRQTLLDNVGPSLDKVLFDQNTAVPELRPAGLLHSVAPLTATAGGGIDALVGDIENLTAALAPVAGNGGVVLVAAPKQAAAIMLRTPRELYPVLMSASLPDKTVIAIASNAVASAVDAPTIGASQHAIQHMADPASQISNGGGIASPVFSSFQIDATDLKLRWPISWALRSPQGIAWVEAVSW